LGAIEHESGQSSAPDPVRGTQRNHEGKCAPVSIGFAEAEDNELCISLDAFTNDDVAPSPIARLPIDVGR